jgi:phosphopantothenoylcysteine decarboxylase / phosphopantothenate---cysteine ligase
MALPKSVLLIISGSIASYKSLELIRLLRTEGVAVTAILTKGGAEFITPLAVSSLTGSKTYTDLFSLTDEVEMGHIELSRVADLVLVAPASANLLAKMATGISDDLATTALLATNKPVVVAPAMNHKMWHHPATQRNLQQLMADGVRVIEPTEGPMACGEFGIGRMAEPASILAALASQLTANQSLACTHAIVTPCAIWATAPQGNKATQSPPPSPLPVRR